jgi:hypothetical protein
MALDLRHPREMEEWEQGVLAARALFLGAVVFAAGAFFASGLFQQVLVGLVFASGIGGFAVGYSAQRVYLAGETEDDRDRDRGDGDVDLAEFAPGGDN